MLLAVVFSLGDAWPFVLWWGLGDVLPFGCSGTIVAGLGRLKPFVYGGEVSCALASNGNRTMVRVEGSPCGVVLSAML